MGGLGIAISAFLTWTALAAAEPAIIEQENGYLSFEQRAADIQPVADIAGSVAHSTATSAR